MFEHLPRHFQSSGADQVNRGQMQQIWYQNEARVQGLPLICHSYILKHIQYKNAHLQNQRNCQVIRTMTSRTTQLKGRKNLLFSNCFQSLLKILRVISIKNCTRISQSIKKYSIWSPIFPKLIQQKQRYIKICKKSRN